MNKEIMKLIIGLGNPGEKYTNTRHNAGFLFLDFLQEALEMESFHEEKKFQAALSSGSLAEQKILLVKPLTFMNDSGSAVAALLRFYKLTPQDILVVHDELDLPLGTFKKTSDSRAAGHNGVQNIIDMLGTQEFPRLRIGISRPIPEENGVCISVHDYVLQKFPPEEEQPIRNLFPKMKEEIINFVG